MDVEIALTLMISFGMLIAFIKSEFHNRIATNKYCEIHCHV